MESNSFRDLNAQELNSINGGFGAILAGVAILIAGSSFSYNLGKDFYHMTK